eukprot:15472143-Alexandrium_andersonii.AAC.1
MPAPVPAIVANRAERFCTAPAHAYSSTPCMPLNLLGRRELPFKGAQDFPGLQPQSTDVQLP